MVWQVSIDRAVYAPLPVESGRRETEDSMPTIADTRAKCKDRLEIGTEKHLSHRHDEHGALFFELK